MPDPAEMTLGRLDIRKARKLPKNPRKTHRIGPLCAQIRRNGFGSAVTVNTTTGHTLAGNGRIAALRKMKRAGEPPPPGVVVEGKAWTVAAVFGTWPEDRERDVATALNGGVSGSLEGDLDQGLIADFLEGATDEAREALGLSPAQADQIVTDHAEPLVEPQINLDGLHRTEAAKADNAAKLVSLKLLIPAALANRARQAMLAGLSPADLLQHGLPDDAKTERKTGKAATKKAKRRPAKRKGKTGPKNH